MGKNEAWGALVLGIMAFSFLLAGMRWWIDDFGVPFGRPPAWYQWPGVIAAFALFVAAALAATALAGYCVYAVGCFVVFLIGGLELT